MRIKLKRVYESPSPKDGARVLVDRLWPRGIGKDAAALDVWLKEIAPSDALRRWFGHDRERWQELAQHYRRELTEKPEVIERLRQAVSGKVLTLVYAAKDCEHNNAMVLKMFLEQAELSR